jgi:hypothetical protein
MKELLISILEQFCPDDVYLQGTLNPDDAYPAKFITFFTTTTDDVAFFDDDVAAVSWEFAVVFYSRNPTEVNTIPAQIRSALKAAGFIPQGKGYDIMSDTPTHTGWAMDFLYRENITN